MARREIHNSIVLKIVALHCQRAILPGAREAHGAEPGMPSKQDFTIVLSGPSDRAQPWR